MENRKLVFAAIFTPLFLLFFSVCGSAEDKKRSQFYPFDVTLGGQAAQMDGNALFARIAKPVANDAEMVLKAEAETIFVNIFRCNESGEISRAGSAKAKVIVAPNATKVKLNEIMDKSVLEDGLYLMNIVLSSKGTSRVIFRVGEGDPATKTDKKPSATIDHSKPENVLEAVFSAARSGDFSALMSLLPPSGKNDGDVTQVCTVAEADEKAVKNFRSFFQKGKISGKARISAGGSKAEVDFLFGPDGTKKETMNFLKEDGKWYLGSF